MRAIERWVTLGVIGLSILVGCGHGHATDPHPAPTDNPLVIPEAPFGADPFRAPGDPDPEPAHSGSSVIEGEVELTGPTPENPTGSDTKIVTFDIPAHQLAIVQFEAEAGGDSEGNAAVIAHLDHAIGTVSIAPFPAHFSTYAIPRGTRPETFVRRFDEAGKLQLQLTNRTAGGAAALNAPVRWKYRISPSPLPPPGITTPGTPFTDPQHVTEQAIELGTLIASSLVRGDSSPFWTTRQLLYFPVERGKSYRLSVRPQLAPADWVWHADVTLGAFPALQPLLPATDPGQLEVEFTASSNFLAAQLRVWVDVPAGGPDRMEAASFEALVEEVPVSPPVIRDLLPQVFQWRYYTMGPDGVFEAKENTELRMFLATSSSVSSIEIDGKSEPLNSLWSVTIGEAGEHSIRVVAANAAGTSEPFLLRYRATPALPKIELSTVLPHPVLIEPVTFHADATYRVTDIAWDFGVYAIPRYATGESPTVTYFTGGRQGVRVTGRNEIGSTTTFREFSIGGTSPGEFQPSVRLRPGSPGDVVHWTGVPSAGLPVDTPLNLEWFLPEGAEIMQADARSVDVRLTAPGIHLATMINRSAAGGQSATPFRFVVNPAGTALLAGMDIGESPLPLSSYLRACAYRGDVVVVRQQATQVQMQLIHSPTAPEPGGYQWDTYPPISNVHLSYSSSDHYFGATVLQDRLFVATLDSALEPVVWEVDAAQSTPYSLPILEPGQDIVSAGVTAIQLSAWNDNLVVTRVAKPRGAQPARLAVALVPLDPDPRVDQTDIESAPVGNLSPSIIGLASHAQGLVGLLHDLDGDFLFRLPISGGGALAPIQTRRNTVWGELSAPVVDSAGIWSTTLKAIQSSPELTVNCALLGTTWNDYLSPESWSATPILPEWLILKALPLPTSSGIHVLVRVIAATPRTLELIPNGAQGWDIIDRVDLAGELSLNNYNEPGSPILMNADPPASDVNAFSHLYVVQFP